jgi:hypothetical protein
LHLAYRRLRPTASHAYPAIEARLRTAGLLASEPEASLVTTYELDCFNAGVPVPPPWGQWATPTQSGWSWNGTLQQAFIPPSTPLGYTDVFHYSSDSPRGTCIALPRSNGTSIELLGVICHGVDTSKACYWDNENVPWSSPPIHISQFIKGNSPDIANNGTCTNCHAGENPFVIHPGSALDLTGKVPASRWNTKNWYDPLIHASLPQNPGPTNAIAKPLTQTCNGCHSAGVPESTSVFWDDDAHVASMTAAQGSCMTCHSTQRLPELATTTSFCGSILDKAIDMTMPPTNPQGLDYSTHIAALEARCNTSVSLRCSHDNAKICAQAGGYCEQAFSKTNARHDLCRWPAATSATACTSTAGIWTPTGSPFALEWPTSVFANTQGACITQMKNIGGRPSTAQACTTANRDICRRRGGFCEDAINTNGNSHQLCRWPNHDTQAKCASTVGLWTTKTSGFAVFHPTAVRRDEEGSCITQMANIGGTPN